MRVKEATLINVEERKRLRRTPYQGNCHTIFACVWFKYFRYWRIFGWQVKVRVSIPGHVLQSEWYIFVIGNQDLYFNQKHVTVSGSENRGVNEPRTSTNFQFGTTVQHVWEFDGPILRYLQTLFWEMSPPSPRKTYFDCKMGLGHFRLETQSLRCREYSRPVESSVNQRFELFTGRFLVANLFRFSIKNHLHCLANLQLSQLTLCSFKSPQFLRSFVWHSNLVILPAIYTIHLNYLFTPKSLCWP